VAELYDRARPSYPAAAIDALIERAGLSPGTAVYEVGAGTGKATVLLAQRGLRILAIEPASAMAAIARANCAPYPEVEIVESDFERWRPGERRRALISAQAWHWIAPDERYHRAHEALEPEGKLIAMWTLPDWDRCALRDAFSQVYRATVPHMRADFPMHPDSDPPSMSGDWNEEIAGAGTWFTDPVVQTFRWEQSYAARDYARLVSTHQDHILLAEDHRAAVLEGIEAVVVRAGGTVAMPYLTNLCLATAIP
jgi:SAM-dependent methyltransferase